MDDDDRGWPLEKEAIRAKYYDLLQEDKVLQVHNPKRDAHLSKSMSTREAYSRARNLQRVLQRTGWTDPRTKGSRSLPVSSPSSVSGAASSSRRSKSKSHAGGIGSREEVLAPLANELKVKTKFLAKQFKLITNIANAPPRRNINILAKDPPEASKAMVVAEKMEILDRPLQERIRVHETDQTDPSNLETLSLRLDSLSRSSGPREWSSSDGDQAHASSPSSVISDVSVPETEISSVENEWIHHKLTSFSFTRERWTSREIFGSFDFGGELDIAASVEEATHPNSSPGYLDHDRPNSCSDESSPSSGMRSPRQSLCTSSSQGGDDLRYNSRCRGEPCGVPTQRVKVTSPSSLFRDGPWPPNGRQQRLPSSSPNIPGRKLSRKLLSTSSNKRRRKPMKTSAAVQPRRASLSTRRRRRLDCKGDDSEPPRLRPGSGSGPGSWILQIAGLVSAYRGSSPAGGASRGALQSEAPVAAFQDEIAQLMLDGRERHGVGDVEEFLEGYMRLRSPIYVDVVEEFFRTVSSDCYRRRD